MNRIKITKISQLKSVLIDYDQNDLDILESVGCLYLARRQRENSISKWWLEYPNGVIVAKFDEIDQDAVHDSLVEPKPEPPLSA
jgi:hypothetical protein